MGLLLVLLIFALFAISISLLFNLTSIESLFASLCITIFLAMAIIAFISLSITVYALCAIILVVFIISIVYSISKKVFIERIKNFFNSPALAMLFSVLIIYSLQINGLKTAYWDDFTHWSLAPKAILKYNGVKIPYGIAVSAQTYTLPIYNSLFLFFTGFRQDVLVISKWFFSWICLLLPFAHRQFKDTKRVAFYTIILFSIILTMEEITFVHLYSELYMFSIWAGLIGYYYIYKNKKATNYIVLLSFLILPQIKDVLGLVVCVFLLIILLFDWIYTNKGKLKRKHFIFIGSAIAITFVNTKLNEYIKALSQTRDAEFTPYNEIAQIDTSFVPWNDFYSSIKTGLKSPIALALIAATGVLAVLFIISIYRENTRVKYYGLGTLLFAAVLVRYLYNCLDANSYELINVYFNSVFGLEVLNMPLSMLLGLIITICTAYYIYMLDDKYKQYFLSLCGIVLVQALFIGALTLLRYSLLDRIEFIEKSWSLTRYLGLSVYFVIFLVPMYFLGMPGVFKKQNEKMKTFILAISIIFILLGTTLKPLEVYKVKEISNMYIDKTYTATIKCGELVENYTDEDDNICYISDIRTHGMINGRDLVTLRFYTLIPETNYIWLYPDEDIEAQTQNIIDFLKANDFNKIIYRKYDYVIKNNFTQIFSNTENIADVNLYDIVWENDKIILENACN